MVGETTKSKRSLFGMLALSGAIMAELRLSTFLIKEYTPNHALLAMLGEQVPQQLTQDYHR